MSICYVAISYTKGGVYHVEKQSTYQSYILSYTLLLLVIPSGRFSWLPKKLILFGFQNKGSTSTYIFSFRRSFYRLYAILYEFHVYSFFVVCRKGIENHISNSKEFESRACGSASCTGIVILSLFFFFESVFPSLSSSTCDDL